MTGYSDFRLLFAVVLMTGLLVFYHYPHRRLAAAFLAFMWQFHTRLLSNAFFMPNGGFNVILSNDSMVNAPMTTILGNALICGFLMVLLLGHMSLLRLLAASVVASLIVDFDVLTLLVCVIPATILGRFTLIKVHVGLRNILQAMIWGCTLLWFMPNMLFLMTDDSWQVLLTTDIGLLLVKLSPMILPAMIIVSAIYEFSNKGQGTPFPYDPPCRLVYSGVYGYVSNPMQLAVCLMLGYWGWLLESLFVLIMALSAWMMFIVFKDVCNGSCQVGKTDPLWTDYQKSVPKWFPRFTPWLPSQSVNQ